MSEEKAPRLCFETYVGKGQHLKIEKRPFSSFPLHAHAYFELEIVLSGHGTQEIDGQTFSMEKGAAFLLSPSAFHKVTAESGETVLFNISFDETAAEVRLPAGAGSLYRMLTKEELETVKSGCQLLLREKEPAAAFLLLSYILKKVCGTAPDPIGADPIQKAAKHARLHFREKLTVPDGAAVACLSPVYFGALFAERMGCSYNTFLSRCRVECAKRLLLAGMTVSEACFGAGFGSLSAFGTAFRRETGRSPSEYRRRARQDL